MRFPFVALQKVPAEHRQNNRFEIRIKARLGLMSDADGSFKTGWEFSLLDDEEQIGQGRSCAGPQIPPEAQARRERPHSTMTPLQNLILEHHPEAHVFDNIVSGAVFTFEASDADRDDPQPVAKLNYFVRWIIGGRY